MSRVRTVRISPRGLLIPSMSLALLALAHEAQAELAAQFRDKIDVDVEYAPGVGQATDIAFAADGRAIITRKNGTVTIRAANGSLKQLTGVFGSVDSQSEKGLLGVVADPNVAENNTFYFYVSNGPSTTDKHHVRKAVLTAEDTLTIDPMPIIAASRNNGPGLEGPANHDGGGLVIHKGHLYIGVGDTGANATTPENRYGSCLNKGNGKILRVNLDGSIPDDNPLVNVASVSTCEKAQANMQDKSFGTGAPDKRIFAWGLRNPWRLWIDPLTDLMWIGDVGESTDEEISIGKGGEHFGYPFVEGDRNHAASGGLFKGMTCMDIQPARPCTAPAFRYATNESGGSKAPGSFFNGSVIGGLIPTGCGWDEALGGPHYLYADSVKNWVRALPVKSDRTGLSSTTKVDFENLPAGTAPVSFRMGPEQALYIVYHEAGAVYQYKPKNRTGPGCDGGTGGGGMGAGGASGGTGGSGASAGSVGVGGSGGGAPPVGGTTGGGAPGGTAGTAGAPAPSGGRGGTGGTPGTAGTVSTAGTAPGAGSSSVSGAPGSSGAPPGTAGSGAGAPGSGGDDGGCGCRLVGSSTTTALWAAALVGAAGLARRRWRRRTSSTRDS